MLISFKAIGRNIRTARMDMNLTQEDVAERLKISQLHFGRLERGDRPVSLEMLALIADILETPLSALLNGCVVNDRFDPKPAGIARTLHRGYRKRLFPAGSAADAGALQNRRAER